MGLASNLLRGWLVILAIFEIVEIVKPWESFEKGIMGAVDPTGASGVLPHIDVVHRLWGFLIALLALVRLAAAADLYNPIMQILNAAVHIVEAVVFGLEFYAYRTSHEEKLPIVIIVFVNALLFSGWAAAAVGMAAANSTRPKSDSKSE
mmetsp:Transcript_20342/g.53115  ORF Transcript_20342/g.53115 Transcript_20342/m.53115 type:complete len:149 (+) Transcript_20342:26-472(+)